MITGVSVYPSDIDVIMELYAKFCENDEYIAALADGMETKEFVLNEFREDILKVLSCGDSFGIYDNNTLVGFVLGFSTTLMKDMFPGTYNRIFDKADTVKRYIDQFTSEVFFILAIGVEDKYTKSTILQQTLSKMIKEAGNEYTYVSDLVEAELDGVFLNCNFRKEQFYSRHFYVKLYGGKA